MKRIPVLLALLCVIVFGGCNMTPSQQYKLDASLYNGASIGLTVAHDAGKIKPETWAKIQPIMLQIQGQLMTAYQWLQANPTLANTPGYPLPGAQPLDLAIGALMAYYGAFPTVPTNTPPSAPTTSPSEAHYALPDSGLPALAERLRE